MCPNNSPQTHGAVRRAGVLSGSVPNFTHVPRGGLAKQHPSVLVTQDNRPHMRTNDAHAISHPVCAHTLTWFLCWPFKPPGPSWGHGDKSTSLEQGTWEAERREVRTVRGDGRPSGQTAVVAGAGARSGLDPSRLPLKPARAPGTQLWAVSKDKFSTNDLILQNSPRASERSGQHHFDKVESGRHCWSHNVGGGTGVLPSAPHRGAGTGEGQRVVAGIRLGEAWGIATLLSSGFRDPRCGELV